MEAAQTFQGSQAPNHAEHCSMKRAARPVSCQADTLSMNMLCEMLIGEA